MKPLISIVIPTLGRPTLYPLIENLLKQKTRSKYEIVLVPQIKLDESRIKDEKIKLFYEPLGKGFAYYRNLGIKKSQGKIIAFIDDDEIPMNNNWLEQITKPILRGQEEVTTAGIKIKLGQGYLTDSISLLGFPGGGAVGFRTMWKVTQENYTEHLCSGNLAITRTLLKKINNFTISMRNGNEDVDLADKIIEIKKPIKYVESATVYHIARKGLMNFVKWNYLRGKSAKEYLSSSKSNGKITNRLKSSLKILNKIAVSQTSYLPGVIFVMITQYIFQIFGAFRK